MRRLAASVLVGTLLLLLGALLLAPRPVAGGANDVLTRIVVCTTTLAHLYTANPNRLSILAQNVGTLHVGAVLTLDDYQGGLSCQMSTGTTAVEIMETVN